MPPPEPARSAKPTSTAANMRCARATPPKLRGCSALRRTAARKALPSGKAPMPNSANLVLRRETSFADQEKDRAILDDPANRLGRHRFWSLRIEVRRLLKGFEAVKDLLLDHVGADTSRA